MTERFFTVHKAIDVETLAKMVDLIREVMPRHEVWVQGDVDPETAAPTLLVWGRPERDKGDLERRRRAAAASAMSSVGEGWAS